MQRPVSGRKRGVCDDHRPRLTDLRESGSIEQDADAVLFVFREETYLKRDEPTDPAKHDVWLHRCDAAMNVAEVIIAKQRQGATGTAKLRFDAARTIFSDPEDDFDEMFQQPAPPDD